MLYWQGPVAALVMAASVALPPPTPAQQQGMIEAVRQMLEQAHEQPQDMPKRIISVEPLGGERYKVHMEMVQGDAWFELTWTGQRWTVKGLNQ